MLSRCPERPHVQMADDGLVQAKGAAAWARSAAACIGVASRS
jgi:hypothetical protein